MPGIANGAGVNPVDAQRRRARRTAIGLFVVAAVIYAGFIYFSVRHGQG
jgi:hypothetical protein